MKMKQLALALLLISSLTACKAAEDAQKTIEEGAKLTTGQIDRAKVLSDLTQITGALATYRMQNEKYPDSLKDLNLSLNYPQDLEYDAKTGNVRSKTFPDL
ncbi:hypothetical protein COW36_12445 [bacterium (Candidatus Blackallbacteria) CG17_big_fil_post_rev_8_21_14_2_50_48_46]|uniref:Type II secretion system protein GspG C-terminal domain-containing protein n=1 Tax=bacterium (Candidatus Blackallbacteria) CG17_big_fil_post_rev_8_21_14_2_50_48_46 TaxID=2014261 RepID=A0A2M7G3W5_9BACT|nr:MAG: hypothetical protein COW64_02815 [bacterium (Candidatus Blackallbacteria) CG18_big_fil_WC_8_21_14_2_50_49_26]PIW16570.1 MAG: hypothetical protein COW36_12445 [bacterium (Candidatus Blackallbacteria) CG17_big_fil_post_rev_8_21_14_2_50_48_46]PIW46078.1 MAG: hypothetical protein COW20_17710 [bacterium (Candidatus Blackallbacteria) CG13_big_fil_rev_8_21_14_2_50_49_14]